ncbi:hypothetical protein GQ44DRAFT_786983 [Phaeosphaeriaceae sp. PMI808]|nr:hypothetical protein GQ44DRAFT_786983 [Phaeosphaeriaceae sp. PMI808]
MASYKITIKNKMGGPQYYSFFCERPSVSGGVTGDLWSNILKAAPATPTGGNTSFEIATKYYAIARSFDGDATMVARSLSTRPFQSSLALRRTEYHKRAATTPGQGKVGNFFVDTACNPPNVFTFQEAKNNNVFIDIASGEDDSVTTAMGTFTPYPNSKYQIMPVAIYYVACGTRFSAGDLVEVEMIGSLMAVDFAARQTNSVTLIHNDNLQFEFA